MDLPTLVATIQDHGINIQNEKTVRIQGWSTVITHNINLFSE